MTRELTFTEKAFLAGFNRLFASMLGWRQDAINEAYVRTFGMGGLMKFGKLITDVLQTLRDRYGEAMAQHLVGFAGMMNGCGFCGIGHNLTANVLIYRDRGVLFPIDELDVPQMLRMHDEEILTLLRERLTGTEFEDELRLLERMAVLRGGAEREPKPDDEYLRLALDMWLINNECTIEVGYDIEPEDVPIFAKFEKDGDLYQRYRKAREVAE